MIILKYLIPCLILSIGTGSIAGLIISGNLYFYTTLDKPPAAPVPTLFPIVWTIIYILMGIAHYFIYLSSSDERQRAIKLYYLQLIVNFLWPLIFFRIKALFLSVICIIILLALVIKTTKTFYRIKPIAGKLMIPYIVWLLFASYLNIGVWLLN